MAYGSLQRIVTPQERKKIIWLYTQENLSQKSLRKRFGLSVEQVKKVLRDAGITLDGGNSRLEY